MGNDRELLELAAKAAGVKYSVRDDEYYKTHKFFGLWIVYDYEPSEYTRRYWNPLTDGGDALRLAVKLRMEVDAWGAGASAVVKANGRAMVTEPHYGDDPYRATRRAIVRAAAEVGRAME